MTVDICDVCEEPIAEEFRDLTGVCDYCWELWVAACESVDPPTPSDWIRNRRVYLGLDISHLESASDSMAQA